MVSNFLIFDLIKLSILASLISSPASANISPVSSLKMSLAKNLPCISSNGTKILANPFSVKFLLWRLVNLSPLSSSNLFCLLE